VAGPTGPGADGGGTTVDQGRPRCAPRVDTRCRRAPGDELPVDDGGGALGLLDCAGCQVLSLTALAAGRARRPGPIGAALLHNRPVTTPPDTLDGAAVLAVADLAGTTATGATRHVVLGVERPEFAYLAIARYPDEPGYYLFYCDETWSVITDTLHETREQAEGQAVFEFSGVRFRAM